MLNLIRNSVIVGLYLLIFVAGASATEIIANGDSYTISVEPGTYGDNVGPVLANDVAIDTTFYEFGGPPEQYDPEHGSIVGASGVPYGVWFYTPDPGYTGSDSFQYTICDIFAAHCDTATVTIFVIRNDNSGDPDDPGSMSCSRRSSVGKPINVTNGNMFLSQTDYHISAFIPSLDVTRNYNSNTQTTGIFGTGWTSEYDSHLIVYDTRMVGVRIGDDSELFFGRTGSSGAFNSVGPGNFAQVVKNVDNSYTLTFKDGRVSNFSSAGVLTSFSDRNSNTTTLTYSSGKLQSVADIFGRTLTFTTDGGGKVTEIEDSLGTVAEYVYGSNDRLASVTYPDGSEYNFTYILQGGTDLRLTEITDALGHTIEKHEYYTNGKAKTSEGEDGADKYTLTYLSSNATYVVDGLGRAATYNHTFILGRYYVTEIEGVCGCGSGGNQTQAWEYDSRANTTKEIDGNGHETTFTYDSNGNMLTRTDDAGPVTYTYNALNEVLTRTDQMSGVTTLTYDAYGNLETITDPLSHTRTLTYDAQGQPLTFENARGKTTTFTWTDGNLTQVTDALSHDIDLTYDGRSRLDTITNALSHVIDLDYDDNNRLEKVTLPDTNYFEYTFDAGGRRTAVRDARGKTTTFGYDDNNRLTSITDPLSHSKSFAYDDMSNLTSVTDANSNETAYEYDDFNQLKKITYPVPAPSATPLHQDMTYDHAGNLKTRTDTAGRVTEYDYDDIDRIIKITDALSGETEFDYNGRSQLTKVTDALDQEYDFTYNALGRQLTQTRNGTTMTFTYDENGNRATRTDHNGTETTYTYNDLDRLTDVAYDSSSNFATYDYDELSRLTSAVNQNGTVSFAYDNRGRVTSSTDVYSHTVGYSYDGNGNRTALTLDTNPHTSYEYDDAGRLITLTDEEASNDFTFDYDPGNRLIEKTLPNGVETTYTYDGMSRLKRLKHMYSSTPLFDDQYSYNAAGQISQIDGLSQTRDFTYDDLDRLTEVSVSSTPVESYSYDAVGNRTASHLAPSYTYGPFNRMTQAELLFDYGYDNNGNILSGAEDTGEIMVMDPKGFSSKFDEENRLTEIDVVARSGVTAIYAYDALSRRVKESKGLVETTFTYDRLDGLLDNDGTTQTTYQNGLGIDDKLKLNDGANAYFLQDHLGSTAALANDGGSVTQSSAYDSFGIPIGSSLTTRYKFTGREHDTEIGLYYYRSRTYDPLIGRFISEDPIGFGGGDINLYGYVKNDPVKQKDPTGRQIGPNEAIYYNNAKGCVEKGLEMSCDIRKPRPGENAVDEGARQAQASFDNHTGNFTGLQYQQGFQNNPLCQEVIKNSGDVMQDGLPPGLGSSVPDPTGGLKKYRRQTLSDWFWSWFY